METETNPTILYIVMSKAVAITTTAAARMWSKRKRWNDDKEKTHIVVGWQEMPRGGYFKLYL